ncbi:MAG TPA: methyltransferase domain-containing protein [Candidatus Nanoarchaeia archaeon]|nr:methyltransferase domain-containing protein [Candidatus Nanoarchaeia archaeon]
MLELDLGCGTLERNGAIGLDYNLDILLGQQKAVCAEITGEKANGNGRISLPFRENSFDQIRALDVLEHVSGDIRWVMGEIHRVARPNAQVVIQYPHFSSPNTYSDVTHVRVWGYRAFDHFAANTELGDRYRYFEGFGRRFPFELVSKEVEFPGAQRGGLSAKLVRKMSTLLYTLGGPLAYELYVARVLPLGNVTINLKVIKE